MMSWQTINEMLGLAAIDHDFREQLLSHPLTAARQRGFQLTPYERKVIRELNARDLSEFSQIILTRLGPEN